MQLDKETKKTYTFIIIAVLLGLMLALFLPTGAGLTALGKNILVVMIPVIFLWITVSMGWPSVLAVALLILVGLDATATYAGSWGNYIVPTFIFALTFTTVLEKTGVIETIARWFISRKFVQGKPYRFVFMFFSAHFILSLLLLTESTMILFLSLGKEMLTKMGYKRGDSFYTMIMLGVLWIGAICDGASPLCHPIPMTVMGIIESTSGNTISYMEYMQIGIPFGVIMFFIQMFIFKFVWKPDTSLYMNIIVEEERNNVKPFTRAGKFAMVTFTIVILLWLTPALLESAAPAYSAFMNKIGVSVAPAVGIAFLCAVRDKGEPICDLADCMKKVPWFIVLFLVAILAFSSIINSETTGIGAALTNIFSSWMGGLGPIFMIIISGLLVTVLTNVMSNMVAFSIFFFIGLPMVTDVISAASFGVMLCCFTNMAVLMGPSSTFCALVYGSGEITVKETIKYNIPYLIFGFIASAAIMIPMTIAIGV